MSFRFKHKTKYTPKMKIGTLLLSSIEKKTIFNPYQLSPSINPKMIPDLIRTKDFTSAIIIALKLNLNIRKLITKIPI